MSVVNPRQARQERATLETSIAVEIDLDFEAYGEGSTNTKPPIISVDTGIGMLDHLLTTLAKHAGWSLRVSGRGDLHIDDHHTAEDVALTLGSALDEAIGPRRGIARFGEALAPLDESLARAVVDVSSRPHATVNLGLEREMLGSLATENIKHVVESFAQTARLTIHLDLIRGENDHHRAEAAFKALALALRRALTPSSSRDVPSTKGTLD